MGISSRETQAYFQVFVAMPLGGLVGLVTGAAGLAAIVAERRTALLIVALIGALVLIATAVIGVRWSTPKRPAEFRVRNDASEPLEQTYLGHDFRLTHWSFFSFSFLWKNCSSFRQIKNLFSQRTH